MYPSVAVKSMIEYIYTASVRDMENSVRKFVSGSPEKWKDIQRIHSMMQQIVDLLLLADQFLLPLLKRLCESSAGMLLHYHLVETQKYFELNDSVLLGDDIIESLHTIASDTGCFLLAKQCFLFLHKRFEDHEGELYNCELHLRHPILCPCPYTLATGCTFYGFDYSIDVLAQIQKMALHISHNRISLNQVLGNPSANDAPFLRNIIGKSQSKYRAFSRSVLQLEDFITGLNIHKHDETLASMFLPAEYLLAKDLAKLFRSPELFYPDLDVIISKKENLMGCEILKCHQSILVERCEWFADNIDEESARIDLTKIEIDGIHGKLNRIEPECWRQIIRFCYTGTLDPPRSTEEIIGLVKTAAVLKIDNIKEAIILCIETASDELKLGDFFIDVLSLV